MDKITYDNKEIYTDGSTNSQYFRYQDANEIKSVVNSNGTILEHIYEMLSQETTQTGTELTINNTFADNMKLDLKGNSSQYTTTGKNLIDITNGEFSNNGLTGNWENGKLTYSGKATNTFAGVTIATENNKLPAGTYTFSIDHAVSFKVRFRFAGDSNNDAIIRAGETSTTFTSTATNTRMYIFFNDLTVDTTYSDTLYCQVESGSSATSWEQYTGEIPSPNPQYPQQVKVVTGNNTINIIGKNLLEGLEQGDINSSTGLPTTSSNAFRSTNYINYDTTKTYYASIDGSLLTFNLNLRFYNKNYEYIGYSALNGSGSNFTIIKQTTSLDITPKYFKFRVASSNIPSANVKLMISTLSDLTYEPYVSTSYPLNLGSIELCKIGTYQDYIYKNLVANKWYKYEEINNYTFDGTIQPSDIYTSSSSDKVFAYRSLIKDYLRNNTNICYCTHFISIVNSGFSAVTEGKCCFRFFNGDSNKYFYMSTNDYSTKEEFASWLATEYANGTPVKVYYKLATPISIEITDTTLIEQLEAIYNAQSYDYQTNITQTNAVLPFIITATARVERN